MRSPLWIKHSVVLILVISSIFCFVNIYNTAHEYREAQQDYTEVNHIKHGLFNQSVWAEKVATVILKKIADFNMDESNRKLLQQKIESALHVLVNNINNYLEEKRKDGNLLNQIVVNITISAVYDETKIKQLIPQLAAEILYELEQEKTQEQIKSILEKEIEGYIGNLENNDNNSIFKKLCDKYNARNQFELKEKIQSHIITLESQVDRWNYILFGITILLFIVTYYWFPSKSIVELICILTFWIPGISFPLMTVGAALSNVSINILGENIEFDNQILFSESKSILDLAVLLVQQKDILSLIVGILVIFFSVIFPIFKICLSYYHQNKTVNNIWLNYIITHGAKWSMADVFVVSIFMAFIGFRTLITNQLETLENTSSNVQISTTDLTELHFPILFFIGFVIVNIIFSKHRIRKFVL